MPPIYLDHNATTPLDQEVLAAMLPYFTEHFGNAGSSTHSYGWAAAEAVKVAREQVATLISCEPNEIIFTSGATESLNTALQGVAAAYSAKGNHIITCATEHKAVLDTCAFLEKTGSRVSYLPVDAQGLLSPGDLQAALSPDTILVAVMLANNETGVVQDIASLSAITHAHGALFLCDATQALGKIPVNVEDLGVDLMAFSAHKCYGPKGVGALYIRRRNPRVRLQPLLHGGGHERGWRSGTLNVPGIVGMGAALARCMHKMEIDTARLESLRNKLESALLQLPGVKLNGHPQKRMGHVSNLSFGGVEAEALIMAIRGVAVSTGSACTSASLEPSHVLQAMGLAREEAFSAIRFSLGKSTTEDQIDFAIGHVRQAVLQLRGKKDALKG